MSVLNWWHHHFLMTSLSSGFVWDNVSSVFLIIIICTALNSHIVHPFSAYRHDARTYTHSNSHCTPNAQMQDFAFLDSSLLYGEQSTVPKLASWLSWYRKMLSYSTHTFLLDFDTGDLIHWLSYMLKLSYLSSLLTLSIYIYLLQLTRIYPSLLTFLTKAHIWILTYLHISFVMLTFTHTSTFC